MNNAPLNGGLVRVVQATPEEVAAFLEALDRAGKGGERWAREKLVGLYLVVAREVAQHVEAAPRYLFCKVGNQWKVIFDGGTAFYLGDTLGARYLNCLLHRANVPISAFDLEVEIQPEKGEARSTTSIQHKIDARAKREYEQVLRKLRADKEDAQEAGDQSEVSRLDGEIEVLESALKERGGTDDTGERARGNVRRPIERVVRKLLRGDEQERAFAEHLRNHLSTGYDCLYSQPDGRVWA